jgi:hypothetical protein
MQRSLVGSDLFIRDRYFSSGAGAPRLSLFWVWRAWRREP